MIQRYKAPLVIAAIAVLAIAIGSHGEAMMTADRPVDVAIVDDDSAYLGFQQTVWTGGNDTNLTIHVTNQFPPETTIRRLKATVGGDTRWLLRDGSLGSGETAAATFYDVTCGAEISVEITGNDTSGTLSRSVSC